MTRIRVAFLGLPRMLRDALGELISAHEEMALVVWPVLTDADRTGPEPVDAVILMLETANAATRPPPPGLPGYRRLYGLTAQDSSLYAWSEGAGWVEMGEVSPDELIAIIRTAHHMET